MDLTSTPWIVVEIVVGYIICGLLLGFLVSNSVYKESQNPNDAYSIGIVSCVLWPIALIVILLGGIWFLIFKPLLTPKAVRAKIKADYEQRKQEAIEKGLDPKTVPKRFTPQYED